MWNETSFIMVMQGFQTALLLTILINVLTIRYK